jgi:hypothetical protein
MTNVRDNLKKSRKSVDPERLTERKPAGSIGKMGFEEARKAEQALDDLWRMV